jgi:hypothetical protein
MALSSSLVTRRDHRRQRVALRICSLHRLVLEERLARKGLSHEVLTRLTYTQWEAWLAIAFDKRLWIFEPTASVTRGAKDASSDTSRQSQSAHLQRLKDLDFHPTLFSSPDNLISEIYTQGVVGTWVEPPATPQHYKAIAVGIVGCLSFVFVGSVLSDLPIIIRVLVFVAIVLFAFFSWRYWEILGDSDKPVGSRKRADYDALLGELRSGGTPTKVYRRSLTKALDRIDLFFGDPGRQDKSRFARALR